MKAFGFTAFGGPENQSFLDVPVPEPGQDELLVRVRAVGINPGDWKVRVGGYGDANLPAVLGREVAGTVEKVGPDVTGFAVGDEVFGGCPDMQGGFAELARVTASFAAHRPAALAPADAAVLPVAAGTAYDGLNQLDLAPGATLVVNGAGGGVGVQVTQLALARDLVVIGVASPAKHDFVRSLGGVPVAYGDGVADRIRAAAPQGVDGIFDTVGGDAQRAVAETLDDRSKLTTIADRALVKELGGFGVERDRSTAVLDELARLVVEGVLNPHVTDVHPFTEAVTAMATVESGHARGKVVLTLP